MRCLSRRLFSPTRLTVALVCLVVLLADVAQAWSCTGHMLVAEIAYRHLTSGNRIKADAMAAAFSASGPFPWTPDFVHLSCWPDDLKTWRQYGMSEWHFVDIPYNPEGIPLPPGTADMGGEGMNVVSAVRSMITALKHAGASKAPPYVQLFSLVNLLHFVGDVHQPLHAAALFSTQYPNGDRGGNAELVTVRNKTVKLHALWDQMCQPNGYHPHRPYSERNYKAHITDMADYLEATYVFPTRMRNMANPQIMAEESHEFAANTSYVGVTNGATLSEEYLFDCKRVAEARVTLAGLRLASILNPLLSELHGWSSMPPSSVSLHSLAQDNVPQQQGGHHTLKSLEWILAALLVVAAFLCGALSIHYLHGK